MQRVGFEPGTSWLVDLHPRWHGHGKFIFHLTLFDELIKLLLHSKAANE